MRSRMQLADILSILWVFRQLPKANIAEKYFFFIHFDRLRIFLHTSDCEVFILLLLIVLVDAFAKKLLSRIF
jgi:hypothetical protein